MFFIQHPQALCPCGFAKINTNLDRAFPYESQQGAWHWAGHPLLSTKCSYSDILQRDFNILARIKLLESSQVHGFLQKRNDVRVKGLPVRVFQVIFLALILCIEVSACLNI